jgi:Ca2+-binding EF-hand superfamily protein
LVDRVKDKLYPRGIRGILQLRNALQFADKEQGQTLSYPEFSQVFKDLKIDLPEIDVKNTFKAFDMEGRSQVEYEEFIRALVGPMNKYRTDIISKVFDKLDITQ